MKLKSTLLLSFAIFFGLNLFAQETVLMEDGFEIEKNSLHGNGYPSGFFISGPLKWTDAALVAPNVINNNPDLFWENVFNVNKAGKTFTVAAEADSRPGSAGNQCLKFSMKVADWNSETASIRWRSINGGSVGFKVGQKYKVTMWVKTDANDQLVFVNGSGSPLVVATNDWAEYTFDYTHSLTNVDAKFSMDFNNLGKDYVVYVDDLKIVEVVTTGIDDQQGLKSFSIYPNPATDVVNINCPAEQFEVQLFNVSGKMVKQLPMGAHHQVDISDLKKGVYVLAVSSAQGKMQKKMVKR